MSAHQYSETVYLKGMDLVFFAGGSSYGGGGGSCEAGGYAYAKASTGTWEDPPTHAMPYGALLLGSAGTSIWIPDAQKVSGGTAGRVWKTGVGLNAGPNSSILINPINKTVEQSDPSSSVTSFETSPWTMMPDPISTGTGPAGLRYRAGLAFDSSIHYGSHTAKVIVAQKIDITGPTPRIGWTAQTTTNLPPAAITGLGRLYYMGYDRPGSTQAVYWGPEDMMHLHVLDTATWTWSTITLTGPIPANTNGSANAGLFKRFGYEPQHDIFYYFDAQYGFYCFKRPRGVA
jgi:hypothetical protein